MNKNEFINKVIEYVDGSNRNKLKDFLALTYDSIFDEGYNRGRGEGYYDAYTAGYSFAKEMNANKGE